MLLIGIPPSIEAGPAYPKIPAGFAGIADLLRVLEHSKLALNVAFVVRHGYFLHPKSGKLQEVSRGSVHIYTHNSAPQGTIIVTGRSGYSAKAVAAPRAKAAAMCVLIEVMIFSLIF